MKYLVAFVFALCLLEAEAQRILRSHLLGDSSAKCVLVIRDMDRYGKPKVTVFRGTNSTRLSPGDYSIGYFVDTRFVHSEWIHVSHEMSVADEFIFMEPVKLSEVHFMPPRNDGGIYIDLNYLIDE